MTVPANEIKKIVVLPGDGIGPEVCHEGVRLIQAVQDCTELAFEFDEHLFGGSALREYDTPLHPQTIAACQASDAILLGAVGAPQYDHYSPDKRPESGLLALRSALQVYCNLRPARVYPALADASPLKTHIVRGIDLLVVRELVSGIYFGKPREIREDRGERLAVDTMCYSEHEIRRIAEMAFRFARVRRGKVTSVDKANVLAVSQLWREIVTDVARNFPDIELEHMLVDNCAMQLVTYPDRFDVILTGNLFGDILSDEASVLTGSIGVLPSASLGDHNALFEPVHGSAPDITGRGLANPIAMLSSVAMMFRYSFHRNDIAEAIDQAIGTVLNQGFHTPDLKVNSGTPVSTPELASRIIAETVHLVSDISQKVTPMPR